MANSAYQAAAKRLPSGYRRRRVSYPFKGCFSASSFIPDTAPTECRRVASCCVGQV
ncbi:hypothetical protein C8R44DRAFT_797030 [Mycena epipterygia]|nr:hypothetical protein C8R44DRAFT_797030 [Mycena epipterygia]